MPDLNMRYLRTFLVMVEERSTAKTSHRLGFSQVSALSHVSNIEKVVGERLLERRFPPEKGEAGRTQLTEAGRVFLPKAIMAMRAHDRMFDNAPAGPSLEVDLALAANLVEIIRDILKHDLAEDERNRLLNLLGQ